MGTVSATSPVIKAKRESLNPVRAELVEAFTVHAEVAHSPFDKFRANGIQISSGRINCFNRAAYYAQLRSRGFTLLELLIVMVIVGITLGMVSFNAMPDERQILQQEAQRIALLLQLARDEAIVRNRPIAFEAEPDRYRFLLHEEHVWQILQQDDLLREREFKRSPITFTLSPPAAETTAPLRIVFGREPVSKPFVLTLKIGDLQAAIHADGIGHFSVE